MTCDDMTFVYVNIAILVFNLLYARWTSRWLMRGAEELNALAVVLTAAAKKVLADKAQLEKERSGV